MIVDTHKLHLSFVVRLIKKLPLFVCDSHSGRKEYDIHISDSEAFVVSRTAVAIVSLSLICQVSYCSEYIKIKLILFTDVSYHGEGE